MAYYKYMPPHGPSIAFADGGQWKVTWLEYYFSILPKGQPIQFVCKGKLERGLVRFPWICQDVVALEIETHGGRKSLLPFDIEKIKRCDYADMGMEGAGI
jgi:hypothetical protein